MGYESLEDLIDAVHTGPELERLSFSTMGLTDTLVERLMQGPAVRSLTEIELVGNPLGGTGLWNVLRELPAGVHTLGLGATGAAGRGFDLFASSPALTSVRRLDLSRNPLTPRAARILSRSPHLAGLRSLNLSKCRVGERELYPLTRAKFWHNLVELDLRDNPIPPAGVRHLLDAGVPNDLTALVLGAEQLGTESRESCGSVTAIHVVFARAANTGMSTKADPQITQKTQISRLKTEVALSCLTSRSLSLISIWDLLCNLADQPASWRSPEGHFANGDFRRV